MLLLTVAAQPTKIQASRYKKGVPILQDEENGVSTYSSPCASKAVVCKGIDAGEHNGAID